MSTLALALATLTVVTVAIRSTWSPCGVSMLSALTPLSEAGRGRRWPVTAGWFVAGAVAGGGALGLLLAVPAAAVHALAPSSTVVALVVGVVALAAILTDLRLTSLRMPGHTRQVNEVWITRYRQWVYAGGFGAQIGFGFATVFMTGALYLMAALMIATGSPAASVLLGGLFGLVRGIAILAGYRLTDAVALRSFHRRFEELAGWSIALVVVTEIVCLIAAAAAAGWPLLGIAAAAVPLAVFAVRRSRGGRDHLRLPIAAPIPSDRVPAPAS